MTALTTTFVRRSGSALNGADDEASAAEAGLEVPIRQDEAQDLERGAALQAEDIFHRGHGGPRSPT